MTATRSSKESAEPLRRKRSNRKVTASAEEKPELTFQKLCYEIRAPSLYNDRDIQKALKDAAGEMIGSCKVGSSGHFLVKEQNLISNLMIIFGWLAIAVGLYCFRLQYTRENKLMILYTAMAYWIVAVTFFLMDYAYLDQLVSSYTVRKPEHCPRNEEKSCTGNDTSAEDTTNEPQSKISKCPVHGIYLSYDAERAVVRWVRSDRFSTWSNCMGGLHRLFKWRNVPYVRALIYILEKTRAVARSEDCQFYQIETISLDAEKDDVQVYKDICQILETGEVPVEDSKKTNVCVGITVERDVTHYFNEKGFVVETKLAEDLKKLLIG